MPKVYPPVDISNDVKQVYVLPHIGKKIRESDSLTKRTLHCVGPSQHGFIKDRSTISALIAITQPWFNTTDSTCRDTAGIHTLFIDFRKTFDLVDHGILLNKLAHSTHECQQKFLVVGEKASYLVKLNRSS